MLCQSHRGGRAACPTGLVYNSRTDKERQRHTTSPVQTNTHTHTVLPEDMGCWQWKPFTTDLRLHSWSSIIAYNAAALKVINGCRAAASVVTDRHTVDVIWLEVEEDHYPDWQVRFISIPQQVQLQKQSRKSVSFTNYHHHTIIDIPQTYLYSY